MASSLFFRAASWYWITCAALPNRPVRRRDVTSATMIGVLMSATLPARLGEPARTPSPSPAAPAACGKPSPVLLGTLVSQTLLNLVALALLGVIIVSSHAALSFRHPEALRFQPGAAAAAGRRSRCADVDAAWRQRSPRPHRRRSHRALVQVRAGLAVFREPRRGAAAAAAQLGAWAIQLAACWALLYALGLDDQAGSVPPPRCFSPSTSLPLLPVTPSNVGVFQFAVSASSTPASRSTRSTPSPMASSSGGRDRHRRCARTAGPGARGSDLERQPGAGAFDRSGAARVEAARAGDAQAMAPASASSQRAVRPHR